MAGQPALIADGAQGGDGRLSDEGFAVRSRQFDQPCQHSVVDLFVLATGPGGHLHHGGIIVVEPRGEVHFRMAGGQLGARRRTAGDSSRAGLLEQLGGQGTAALQRSERRSTNRRVVVAQGPAGRGVVTLEAGEDHLSKVASHAGRHRRGQRNRPVSVVTIHDSPMATAMAASTPPTVEMTPRPPTANSRRHHGGRW
jgi:hypothetical protein